MTDVFIYPEATTTTRKEVRAVTAVAKNNLDVSVNDPTRKYAFEIQRVLEPQNDQGQRTGQREPLPVKIVSMADVLARRFVRPNSTGFTGAELLADLNLVIDFYKGQDLGPAVEEPIPADPPTEG